MKYQCRYIIEKKDNREYIQVIGFKNSQEQQTSYPKNYQGINCKPFNEFKEIIFHDTKDKAFYK